MKLSEKKYIVKLRQYSLVHNDYVCYYFVTYYDPFHMIGEYIFRSMGKVEYISFIDWSETRESYLVNNDWIEIKFKPKYL